MPLDNCSFLPYPETPHPVLPVIIHNPHTGKYWRTYGIIDTGADECAIPAWIAAKLGHDLEQGRRSNATTGGGESVAYAHTTSIDIFHPQKDGKAVYTLSNIPVDYMPDLDIVLLGVRSFLSEFVLTIDYPRFRFSIKYPEVDARGV
ncbi:MAG: retroviral-like aspartic protease family protein [Nitrospirae bacterium]|nr:retroviral-like aspartic protease family protein [Nitrospirota bacterium]